MIRQLAGFSARVGMTLALTAAAAADASRDQGKISVTGAGFSDVSSPQGRLLAERAAKVDALRQISEIVDGTQITAGTTVEDMMLTSDRMAARVKGLVRGAVTTDRRNSKEDGAWVSEVDMAICLNAGPAECAGQTTLTQLTQSMLPVPAPDEMFVPVPEEIAAAPAASAAGATGLIVDVSGKDFSPLLDVRIRTSAGKEVYGPGHVAKGTDWLHWADSLDNAKGMTRVVGESPMVVRVDAVGRDSELIVSNEDAISIFKANVENEDFLNAGKVVFIVGG